MKAKNSHRRGNKILYSATGVFGLVALVSHFYLQNPELVWNVSYLSASLDSASEETEKIPATQLRQLQFSAIPLAGKAIDTKQLKLSGTFGYQDSLTSEKITEARNSLVKQEVAQYTSEKHLTAYLENLVIIEENTQPDEENGTFSLSSTINISLVNIPWEEIYQFIEKEALLNEESLKEQGYQVADFSGYYQDEKLYGRLTLVAPPSEKSLLLKAE